MATILCIDDEEAIRTDVCELLESVGHQTHEADQGQSGLDAILKHEPDLVLCDFTMPNMDGGELLVALRENHPGFADMPFIFLSALADRADVLQGIKLGADDYLTKPIDFDLLEFKVTAALRQVGRMKVKKEQEFAALFKALSQTEDGAEPTKPLTLATENAKKPKAQVDPGQHHDTIFGTVWRFDMSRMNGNSPSAQPDADLSATLAKKTIVLLQKALENIADIAPLTPNGLVLCYAATHASVVKKQSDVLKGKLAQHLNTDDLSHIVETATVSNHALSELAEVTSAGHPATTKQYELDSLKGVGAALIEQVSVFNSIDDASESLASSIEEKDGFLVPLNLVRDDDKLVPISFFDLDGETTKRIDAGLALVGPEKRGYARAQVDLVRLKLLKRDVRKYDGVSNLVIDIHYETLSDSTSLHHYMNGFEMFASAVSPRTKLILNIIEHPTNHPNWRFEKLVTPLKSYSTRYMTQGSPNDANRHAQSENSFSAIVCSYADLLASKPGKDEMQAVRHQLAESGKLFILRGLPNRDNLENCREYGFNGCAVSA